MTRPQLPRRLPVLLGVLGCLAPAGCFTSVTPLIPEDVAAALATRPMRRLETPNLRIYYPQGGSEQALRGAARIEGCAAWLKAAAQVHNGLADRRMTLIIPEVTFNNAFVTPPLLGYEPIGVVPTYATIDAFSLEMGLPPDPAAIACHELVHYVHIQQIAGLARILNLLFGELYSPQLGVDAWFFEGLAVHYETLLQPGIGRLAWPYWNGLFAAGVAGRRLNGGDLSSLNRDFDVGNHYLVGSHFVRFLADRYGDGLLWTLVDKQARAIFFPLWVALRFWQAYDKTLPALIDEFADDTTARYPPTARPPQQRVLAAAVGTGARYARGADGSEALLIVDRDVPPRLLVRGPAGDTRLAIDLVDVVPPRRLTIGTPRVLGPPSFTADGRVLYFTALDRSATYLTSRLVRVDIAEGRLDIVHPDLRGGGGSVSPDGRTYVFARAEGDRHDLAALDLLTGDVRVLAVSPTGAFVSLPRYSPDGARIVATLFDGRGRSFRIGVFDSRTGALLQVLTDGSQPAHDAAWAGTDAVVYLSVDATSGARARGFQVYRADLRTGRSEQLTRAPYLAFEPQAMGGSLRFLNREGLTWTLDEVPLAALPEPTAPQAEAPLQDPEGTPSTPAAGAPVAAAAAVPSPPLLVLSDKPYRSTDHLFVPLLHGVSLTAVGRAAVAWGAVLAGNDRLQFHRWMLSGVYQNTPRDPGYGATFAYANRQLAPVTVTTFGSWLNLRDVPPRPAGAPPPTSADFTLLKRQRTAGMDIRRTFVGNPVALGFLLVDDDQPSEPTLTITHRRVAGPYLSASFAGVEATPYGGVRRLLVTSLETSLFPGAWSTSGTTLVDIIGHLSVAPPLPLSRRHRLVLWLTGHAVMGAPAGERWLQVGGTVAGVLYNRRSPDGDSPPEVEPAPLPPAVRFVEPLRGYEDFAIATDSVLIGRASYRVPFIIDWGSASTLWLLPSFFLRELVLLPFANLARDGQGARHAAGGGVLSVRFALGELPLSLSYQLARRFDDDRATVHLVRLGAD